MLHCTTLSTKLHHCTLSEIKTQVFTLSDVLACVSIHCADQKPHSNRDFFKKSNDITLQTCVDTANEYLQAYNTAIGVTSHGFCSLHQCKCAGYAMFLKTFLRSNQLFRIENQYFFIALGQSSIRDPQKGAAEGSRRRTEGRQEGSRRREPQADGR